MRENIEENKKAPSLQELVQPLLSWYQKDHRQLPWRTEVSGYRVWISEIMLQQTRVEAVKPYFKRFMEHYPNILALSQADDEELLKYWEGLGYYSRVRNMKKAAVQIQDEYNGEMPDSYSQLIKLPGIGSYTAGAIASIAFQKPIPAVDGNVLRILSRVRMDDAKITDVHVKKRIEQELLNVMPGEKSGDFNQAMMELGATVCIPNGAPKCEECPWNDKCLAKKLDCISQYPKKESKKQRVIEKKTVLIIKDGEQVAIQKRPDKGLLAGMYELPNFEGHLKENEVLNRLNSMGFKIIRIMPLEPAKHIFTHKEWHMIGYALRVDELEHQQKQNKLLFIEPQETREHYPIPTAFAAYTRYINIILGNDKFT